MIKKSYLLLSLVFAGCSSTGSVNAQPSFIPCAEDKACLAARSRELQDIVKADQDDRIDFQHKTPEQLLEMLKRDEVRRKRVGEIFGEGCFSKAEDYAAAALVFQHGTHPDHFFQTFIWSKRGVELGDAKQSRMMALGIDRYLVNKGQMQLFGSQAGRGPDQDSCWCLEKVEKTFPDRRRKELASKTLAESFDWLKELNKGLNCPNTECEKPLKPSPKGTVPGFW